MISGGWVLHLNYNIYSNGKKWLMADFFRPLRRNNLMDSIVAVAGGLEMATWIDFFLKKKFGKFCQLKNNV